DQPLFLSRPSTQYQVKLGAISGNDPNLSAWAYTGYRFQTGLVTPPVVHNTKDFDVQWRFPSTGGVRQLLAHQGTAWALTDGLNTNVTTDNPD
ncbi:hypothetical protein ACI4A4_27695, partial [Klebsiella pneumoniae]|uniref:hypothetical protein n=1 Tax=Klebsiella pneumoniae TaxID=573 RepID=UPI003852DD3A